MYGLDRHLARLLPQSSIERWLTTARLIRGKRHLYACFL
jgi:hypothetical protein